MFLSISTIDFDPHNIIISEKTRNNIMAGSDFYRLIYSDTLVSTNGIFIKFNLKIGIFTIAFEFFLSLFGSGEFPTMFS